MSALLSQRDVISSFKKETFHNVSILCNIHPMPGDLARQVLKEDTLEKPTQSIFIHLSYYLVCIVDPQKASTLPWPLYDTAAEKKYRTEFSKFVVEYCKKGLLAPVMPSYFVNPACYKVTKLMFQLSQLAVQKALKAIMVREQQILLYEDVAKKFQSNCKDFLVNKEKALTKIMIDKINSHKRKQESIEILAEMLRQKIVQNEMLLQRRKIQLNDLVNNFIKQHSFDEETVSQIELIKDVNQPLPRFEALLEKMDRELDCLETNWETNAGAFIEVVKTCKTTTQSLVQKHTGEMDKKLYIVEYNARTDEINTKDLEAHVNSEQKYILKNIVKENKLIFPNLVRGYFISISFILQNSMVTDDIYKFNEYLEIEKKNYKEMSSALKIALEKLMITEAKLQPLPIRLFHDSVRPSNQIEIPPLPDLSDLKASRDPNETSDESDESYTPLKKSKHFILGRRAVPMFAKPKPISLITPYRHSRDDFLKTLTSCRVSNHDKPDSTHNLASTSQAANRSKGFTKEQIQRLLSTRKSSSSKKVKLNSQRPNIKVHKGGLFNEMIENDLFRIHSSSNLYEGKDKRKQQGRQFSVMQENIPTLLEVSGISVIENNGGSVQDNVFVSLDSTKFQDSPNQTVVQRNSELVEKKPGNILEAPENESDSTLKLLSVNETQSKMLETKADVSMKTPKTAQPKKKSSSIEELINRFNKVRANVMTDKNESKLNDFHSKQEEKVNLGAVNVDVVSANNILLPDLLSPNYSLVKPLDILDDLSFENEGDENKNTRESLGAVLGVDQFDLVD